MRNYFLVEKTEEGLFLAKGKGTDPPEGYDETENWEDWEEMESEEALFTRIKELLNGKTNKK